jgi:hypothetical protein
MKFRDITAVRYAEGLELTCVNSVCAGFVSEKWPTREKYQELPSQAGSLDKGGKNHGRY